jgi:hypothetical protein
MHLFGFIIRTFEICSFILLQLFEYLNEFISP